MGSEALTAISKAAECLLREIPTDVTIVAAAKTRTIEEVKAVIQAGITHIGHNYVQEAQAMVSVLGDRATWHMIGHLQRNKAPEAVQLFDIIETLDSLKLAAILNRRCAQANKILPVLIEINSGREANKSGILVEELEELLINLSNLKHIQVMGLMTMGPLSANPEDSRPYYRLTREAFERATKLNIPGITMHYLSMGMSDTYRIAIEEGANIVRIGTKLFGARSN